MRSTEEWLISRSCQRALFSKAAKAFVRKSLASPLICSVTIGFFLCGIADDPFCPLLKFSSASRTSVLCRCRISIEIFSMVDATIAKVERYSDIRSL